MNSRSLMMMKVVDSARIAWRCSPESMMWFVMLTTTVISSPIISYLRSIKNLYSMCIQKELESDCLETIQEFRYRAFHFWTLCVNMYESNVHFLEFIDELLMSCSSSALLRRPIRCICFTARSTWNYASGWFLDVLIVESEFSNSTLLHCIFSVGKLVEAFTCQIQTHLKTSINI